MPRDNYKQPQVDLLHFIKWFFSCRTRSLVWHVGRVFPVELGPWGLYFFFPQLRRRLTQLVRRRLTQLVRRRLTQLVRRRLTQLVRRRLHCGRAAGSFRMDFSLKTNRNSNKLFVVSDRTSSKAPD